MGWRHSRKNNSSCLIIISPDLDTPDYMMTFAGLVSTLLTLQLPPDQVDSIIPVLADAFGLPEDIRAFLVEKYLPEVKDYFSFLLPSLLYQS